VADDFITSTYLASTAPVLVAPAMNTTMLLHPATQRNLAKLRADGVTIIEPDAGEMACGTVGPGRLSEPQQIVNAALELLKSSKKKDLSGERMLITVGATREEIDPVRFISNRSSGKMGYAIAAAARARGADVTVVAGATTAVPPEGIKLIEVRSAAQMAAAVQHEIKAATIFIGAAAVADYRPAKVAEQKIKKTDDTLTLTLERTADILSQVAASRTNGLIVIGFAAETENVVANAEQKLKSKDLDAIVANDVTRVDAGFDTPTNAVTIVTKDKVLELPLLQKTEVAHRVLDVASELRATKSR